MATIIWFATIVVSYSYYRLYHFTLTAEANSTAQHFVDFTEEEEDLVFRMHRLVGNRYTIYVLLKSDKIMSSIPLIVLLIQWQYVGGRL